MILAATLATTGLMGLTAAPAFAGDDPAPIIGAVYVQHHSKGVYGATVALTSEGNGPFVFTTDHFGKVLFDGALGSPALVDIEWKIRVTSPSDRLMKSQYWDGKSEADTATRRIQIANANSETVSLLADLELGGMLTGHVQSNPAVGEGLANVSVFATATTGYGASAVTDDGGNYLLAGLVPGSYRVSFHANSTGASAPYGYESNSWPNVSDYGLAALLPVAAGDEAVADATLITNGLLSGTVSEVIDGVTSPVVGYRNEAVALYNNNNERISDYVNSVDTDGSYEIATAPGSYKVAFGTYSSGGGFELKQAYDRVDSLALGAEVNVASAKELAGVNAVYGANASLPSVGAATPTVSGEPIVGSILTASAGAWTPAGLALTYQWLRSGSPIEGATGSTYTLAAADTRSTIQVRVSGSKTGYSPTSTTSAATAIVTAVNPGSIVVTVKDASGKPLNGAWVSIVLDDSQQWIGGLSETNGVYTAGGLAAGTYSVTVNPATFGARAFTAKATVLPGKATEVAAQLRAEIKPPTGAGIVPSRSAPGEVPSLLTGQALAFTAQAPAGATSATYRVVFASGATDVTGSLTESPAGTYSAKIPALQSSGSATITATFGYVEGAPVTVAFDVYIDPSGTVVDQYGSPVEGATVTVSRSETEAGTYTDIPDGSALMSPANRTNPGITGADGRFGWDVVAGWYKVTAVKNGVSFVTEGLPVPPEQLDLILPLALTGQAAPAAVTAPRVTGTPALGKVLSVSAATFASLNDATGSIAQSFQWTRDGVPIAGATGANYTIVRADLGTSVSAVLTASRAGFQSWTLDANAVAVAGGGLLAATGVEISGTVLASMLLLVFGSGALVVSRRRTRRRSA